MNSNSEFMRLWNAGVSVKRFHTWSSIKEQNLAAHSWGVAMILLHIGGEEAEDVNLIRAALVHDLHEVEAGDIPYPYKRNDLRVAEAYKDQEEDFNNRYGIEYQLTTKQVTLLKWADMFECLLHAVREVDMGNKLMVPVVQKASGVCLESAPNERARQLVYEVLDVRNR